MTSLWGGAQRADGRRVAGGFSRLGGWGAPKGARGVVAGEKGWLRTEERRLSHSCLHSDIWRPQAGLQRDVASVLFLCPPPTLSPHPSMEVQSAACWSLSAWTWGGGGHVLVCSVQQVAAALRCETEGMKPSLLFFFPLLLIIRTRLHSLGDFSFREKGNNAVNEIISHPTAVTSFPSYSQC